MEINPKLKFIATPWSAPADFKTGGNLYGGGMRDDWMDPYARYIGMPNIYYIIYTVCF